MASSANSPQRMQEAGKAIAQSGQSLSKENDADAIEQAESAAAELERWPDISAAALPDFSAKLDDARKQAGRLAAAQRQLNQAMQSGSGKQPSGDSKQESDGGKQPAKRRRQSTVRR
ncbi:MAG: hypothetical protein R3C99_26660 [Pirellulaceae bacterium]